MSSSPDDAATQSRPDIARRLKALGHPARLAIVELLAEREECICGEIVDDLPLAQSTVSQHLKVLKEAGLVRGTVEGRRTCYCLDPETMRALRADLDDYFDALRLPAPDES